MDNYYENIGQTISQFHSLEFVLRNFLFIHSKMNINNRPLPADLYKLKVNDETNETEFTNFDSLGILIKNANKILITKGKPPIDLYLVEVRDCLAHGRVASIDSLNNKILLKFTQPKNKKVKLSHKIELTEQWFNVINKELNNYINVIYSLSISRTPPKFIR